MFYYSKKAKQKVVHTKRCCHIMHTPKEDIGCFSNAEKADNAGYRLCEHCGPLGKYFARKKNRIAEFCKQHEIKYELEGNVLSLETPFSSWKIITDGLKSFMWLYHKNELGKGRKSTTIVGYHLQSYKSRSILSYLNYICSHDEYRQNNPLHSKYMDK